jgi:hypothetical protein
LKIKEDFFVQQAAVRRCETTLSRFAGFPIFSIFAKGEKQNNLLSRLWRDWPKAT